MAEEITQVLGFDASQAIKTLQQLDGAMARFESRVNSMGSTLGKFNAQPVLIQRAFKSNIDSAVKDISRLRTSLELLSRIVFTQAIVRALSTFRNSLKATARDAADFQKQLALISTIDDTGQSLGQLSDRVRGISDQFNIPLLEAASGLYQTISNQIGDVTESTEFLTKAAEFAKATNSSLADSVDLLSGALKSYNLDVSETEKVSSIFFKTIDLGRVSASELANSLGRILPLGEQVGLELSESGAALAAVTVNGSNAAESITQLRGIITAMAKPTEAMSKTLRDLGFTSAESANQTVGLAGVLRALAESTEGSAEAMVKLFPNVRGLNGAISLTANNLETFAHNFEEINSVASDFSKQKFLQATATDAERVTAQINRLKNAFTVDLGQSLLRSGVQLSDWVGGAENIIDVAKSAGPAILGVAGAFGVARAQALAAKLEFTATAKALGALSLVPVAIGLGSSLGQLIDSQLNDDTLIKNLEKFNADQLKVFQKGLKDRRDAQEKADKELVKQQFQTFQQLNKAYLGDVDNAKNASDALVENVKAGLADVLTTRERLVDELARSVARSEQIAENAQQRILGLEDRKDDIEFDRRTASLSEAQKAVSLGRRAQSLASEAAEQIRKGGLFGDIDQINRGLSLFSKAESLFNESGGIAKRIGNRELENRAIRQGANLIDQQIASEKALAAVQKQRQAEIEAERKSQQAVVNQIREQVKIANDNNGLFNAQGERFSEQDLAKRQAARSAALGKVANLALNQKDLSAQSALGIADFVSRFQNELSRDPLQLAIDAENTTKSIQETLNRAFSTFKLDSGVNVAGLEELLGRKLTTPDQIGQALTEAASEANKLRLEIDKALEVGPKAQALKSEIATIFDTINDRGAIRGVGAAFDPTIKALSTQLGELGTQFSNVLADPSVEKVQALITARNQFSQQALKANFGQQIFGADIQSMDAALVKLKQLSQLPQANTGAMQQQLQKFESVLQASPAGKFQSAATAIGNAATPAQTIAAAFEQGASAAERMANAVSRIGGKSPAKAAKKANGGMIRAFANGGIGVDTISAMLSPGEFVMNSDSTRRFFSQIQAMNAGQTPVYRENGGTTTIGDTTINVNGSSNPKAVATEIAGILNRAQRRGSARLK